MDSTYLRPGSLMRLVGDTWKPEFRDTLTLITENECEKIALPFGSDDFAPVEITPELLIQIGFQRDGLGGLFLNFQEEAYIEYFNYKTPPYFSICFGGSVDLPHIKYIHQIQDLYYALTGKSLEIKLK